MAVPLGTGGHLPQGDQPSDWRAPSPLLRQVHPPDARCTMADQPRRYWCTYQQHHVSAGSGVTGARTSGIAGMPGPHESGQPPAGDRPKERRAPSPGLEGTNPRTGWRFFLKKKKHDFTKLLDADVSDVVCGVIFWFGGLGIFASFLCSWCFLLLCFCLVFRLARCPHLGPGRDVCLRVSRCIPTVSRRTLGTHGDDRHVRADCEEMLGDPV